MREMIIPFRDKRPSIHETAFVDPGARVAGDVTLLEDSAIYFGSVVRGDDDSVVIGPETGILELCLVEAPAGHPVEIRGALISHSAVVHGAKVLEDVVIGIGARVLDGAVVEEAAVVGAGALVPPGKEIPPATLVLGIPAKVVRELSEDEIRRFRREREVVIEKAKIYKKMFSELAQGPYRSLE
ncbi:MAG: gamma carbonic anhydrase family protein [Candidatus Korarchaeota archaeon]|nr:gamma carbonic anhydrase family protein [Candidatus Korarchaeota archaeon]